MYRCLATLFCLLFISHSGFSQCITTYPYTQGFESPTGNWSSGGTGNDWAWGSPSKAFITTAGGGTKCWVTGGLNGSFYNNGERSYVVSPCFDFSAISNPVISMKIYWECEAVYDGTTFQSSIDNGVTWVNVGTDNEASNCMTQNWFNSNNIINLSTLANPKSGWAGSGLPTSGSCQGGNGSNGWVLAKHCLQNLAGQPSVKFRFAFGAGTTCNNFDGFAFDDITIENAPPNVANFSYTCTGSPLQYQFTNLSTPCPTVIAWNFGDPASGSNNGTGQVNPLHTFSAPGVYQVSLTVSGPCNNSSTIVKTISTLTANLTGTSPLCAGNPNGSITTLSGNTTGTATYVLLPSGTTNGTGVFSGLGGGTYTVTVSDAIGCTASSVTTLNNPSPMQWTNTTATQITCHGLQNGQITAQATGGTGLKTYTLSPGGFTNTNGQFSNLSALNYTVVVSDANGCSMSTTMQIQDPPALAILNAVYQSPLCHGAATGTIQVTMTGGTGVLQYTLQPTGNTNGSGSFSNLAPGNYTLTCSDANGCSLTYTAILSEPAELLLDSLKVKSPGCNPNNDGTLTIFAHGGTSPLSYSIGGSFGPNNFFANMTSNSYTVQVKDANACSRSSVVLLQSLNAPVWQIAEVNNISCAGRQDGSIHVLASGNVPIVTYALAPGNLVNSGGDFPSLSAGNYLITVTDANGCTNTTLLAVVEPDVLRINNTRYFTDSCGSLASGNLTIEASGGTGAYLYHLEPGNKTQNSPTFTHLLSGTYQVSVTDQNQCESSTRVDIPEQTCCDAVFIPNAFSPNGDGLNDEFMIKNNAGTELIAFMIANRWGEIVFSALNNFDSWNGHYKGEDAEAGYYYYFYKFKCLSSNKESIRKGDVLLIR